MTDAKASEGNDDGEVLLFVTNGDGTFTCAWCEGIFPNAEAVPDDNDDPICQQCYEGALNEK